MTPSLPVVLSRRAAETPDRPAVVDGLRQLTLAVLEQQSNNLAAHLLAAGIGSKTCVGLFLDRSTDFVVAALAVWKAGAAYLPLDSGTPPERIATILDDAQVSLLLTHRNKGACLPNVSTRVLELDRLPTLPDRNQSLPGLTADAVADRLAYVIYTSGSTGRPRGVEITHANLAHLIDWHVSTFQLTAGDHVSQVAGLGFDAAVWEIWPALAVGAPLYFAEEATRRSPAELRDWLVREGITVAFVPTVLAEALLQTSWPATTPLRWLLTGADTLRRRPPTGLPFTLVNNYGPTECTVVATSGIVSPEGSDLPSIGRPIGRTQAWILDERQTPVPAGEAGELWLAGPLVGRGYRHDPELTARRFVTLNLGNEGPQRFYRTGDRVRRLDSGELAFLGRLDDQVKIRGFRVEPGEVAASLSRCPGVQTCAVMARELDSNGPTLVAYVVPAKGATLRVAELREALAKILPEYMLPAHFVELTSLPLNSSGKLDRAALPTPTPENQPAEPAQPVGTDSSGPLEQEIAGLVASLLGLPSVDPRANFFMLGGHSMLAAQLLVRIRDRLGVSLNLRQLFTAPTVTALAALVSQRLAHK